MSASAIHSSVRPSAVLSSFESPRPSHDMSHSQSPDVKAPDTFGDMDWGNEDESFEVPNFHFDWGVVKDKSAPDHMEQPRKSSPRSQPPVATKSLSNQERLASHHRTYSQTPPSNPSISGSSSVSSNERPDNFTGYRLNAWGDSPTEPAARTGLRTGSDVELAASTSGNSAGAGRIHGGRTFQRVVSAPLARPQIDNTPRYHQEPSAGYSATIRPQLLHTTSTSSIDETQKGSSSRSTCVTPGLMDRQYPTGSTSTARRLVGLSRFGGPARRVVPSTQTEEYENEWREHSPALIASPPSTRASPPIERPPLPALQGIDHDRRDRYRASPTGSRSSPALIVEEEGSCDSRPSRIVTRGQALPTSSPPRPAGRHALTHSDVLDSVGQENIPHQRLGPQEIDHRASASSVMRPLHPAHSVISSASPPEVHRHRQDQSFPDHSKAKSISDAQSHLSYSDQRGMADHATHARTVPAPPTAPIGLQNGKRSYIVNGAPYERVGVLGKGGSSKVYSVICPAKRIIYALKRVTLERADAETYQSYTNEIELLKRLRGHDRVIQLIDHQITFGQGNRPKVLMMVMECGEIDFAMLLEEQRGKPLNMNFVGLYWEQMLQAVQAVHQENVVHTDLKPANFVLVKGRLKIIDFGIAKAIANDTVNIQRDQQIGTVNYMSPEAIQRMNNQKVLKLSYPSDIWSMGCILYQMIYGNPPFAHIPGGPLPKMNAIADPRHAITYPAEAVPKAGLGQHGLNEDHTTLSVRVMPAAIDTMRRCLAYRKELRLTIPELLQHEFLHPRLDVPSLPPGTTSITPDQMAMLVNFVVRQNGLPALPASDTTATDLFEQLMEQNSHD